MVVLTEERARRIYDERRVAKTFYTRGRTGGEFRTRVGVEYDVTVVRLRRNKRPCRMVR